MYPRPPISVVTVLWPGADSALLLLVLTGWRQERRRLRPPGAAGGSHEAVPIEAIKEDRLEMKEAFRLTLGDAYSELVSEDEVVWHEPRDSTDQEERSSDRGRWDFMVTRRSRVETLYGIVSSSGSDRWIS